VSVELVPLLASLFLQVHLPSFTVFANWPTVNTPLHYVSAMDFSPGSGYFGCGNDKGKVLLYRVTHYKNS
jgi:U3 small nucleolar RNA-associated protein 18